jgi:DNA-binding transcriptional LysR family regulator
MDTSMRWIDRIGRRIKLRDLHILQAAAEAGSMAGAADELAISQPAVSYAIAEMEHVLGVPLLDRTSQGVVPTSYGRALLERSVIVFNELRQGVNEIEHLADPAVGEVRIGTTPPMSAIATAVINRLTPRYPRMAFHLVVEPVTVLFRELRQRNIEVAICRIEDELTEEDVKAQILFHDELAVICGKHNPWARRHRSIKLSELMQEPWALYPPASFFGRVTRSVFAANGLEAPRATVTTSSAYALCMLAATGPFLTMHPRTLLRTPQMHPSLTAIVVDMRGTRNPISLITLRNRSLSPAAKLFTEMASTTAKAVKR